MPPAEYFAIRLDVVWQTAHDDIPPLIDQLNLLVPQEEDDSVAENDDNR